MSRIRASSKQPTPNNIQYTFLQLPVPLMMKLPKSGPKYGDDKKHAVQIPIFFAC